MPDPQQPQDQQQGQGFMATLAPFLPVLLGGLAGLNKQGWGGVPAGLALGGAMSLGAQGKGQLEAQRLQNVQRQQDLQQQNIQSEIQSRGAQAAAAQQRANVEQQKLDQGTVAQRAQFVNTQKEQQFYSLWSEELANSGDPQKATLAVTKAHPELLPYLPKEVREQVIGMKGAPGTMGAVNPYLKDVPLENRSLVKSLMQQAGQDPDKDKPSPQVEEAARKQIAKEKEDKGIHITVAGAEARGQAFASAREQAQEKYHTWLMSNAPVDPKQVNGYMSQTGATPANDPKFKNVTDRTAQKIADAGYRYINPKFQANFALSAVALTQIDRIEKKGEALFKGVEPGDNIGNAWALKAKNLFGDAATRGFKAVVLETLPTNAVASGLTAGRVGDSVIENIEKPIMPNETDTYASFKEKIKNLRQRAQNNMKVYYGDGIDPTLLGGSGGSVGGGMSVNVNGQQIPVSVK